MAPLPLARVGVGTDIAGQPGDVAEHEAGERQPAAARTARAIVFEVELAGAMPVARHAQVEGAPHVDTELHRVIAAHFRDVADNLVLLLVLVERAVAPSRAIAQA